jgi:hypothetical protein
MQATSRVHFTPHIETEDLQTIPPRAMAPCAVMMIVAFIRGCATNDLENQELTMLALHLLQICLVYINTLMIQRVLTEPDWTQRMLPEDLRALTPLIYSHVTPYGTFRLDMNQRLAIEQDAAAA